MPEQIGKKRERLTVELATETADSEGQMVKTWVAFRTMWARAEFLMGRELDAMQKINAEITTRFTVNYQNDLTEKMRIKWRLLNWNIHAILPTEDKFDMAIFASKVE